MFGWMKPGPRNQGASLTAWELQQMGVPHTLIVDNAGGHLMQQGKVDIVITGADRVDAEGYAANKIGTYLKALAAADNEIPFYIAMPSSTIDWGNPLGQIPVEERSQDEVLNIPGGKLGNKIVSVNLAPKHTIAANPSFDITPPRLITGYITERGRSDIGWKGITALFLHDAKDEGVIKYSQVWKRNVLPSPKEADALLAIRDALFAGTGSVQMPMVWDLKCVCSPA